MSKSLNRVELIGNLGKDVELKYTTSGKAVAKITIATNEYSKEKGERTEWHNVVLWEKLAEVAGEYLKKGSKVYVDGRLGTRSWDDAKTGEKKYMTEVTANNLIMLTSSAADASTPAAPQASTPITDDDIPF
jgi:single-strand DNA-binding protein